MSQKSEPLTSLVSTKTYKYVCNCLVCNGKEVVARTQEKHANNKELWKSKSSRKNQLARIESRKYSKFIKLQRCYYQIEYPIYQIFIFWVPDISIFILCDIYYLS
jgi:hypothetical protein